MDVIVALTLPLPELRFIWKAMNGHVTRPPAASCTLPTLVHDVGSAPPLPMPTYAPRAREGVGEGRRDRLSGRR